MIDKKEHSEGITSTIIRSISHQSETLAHNNATLKSRSSTILKERQSLDHQLSHLKEQSERSTSSISHQSETLAPDRATLQSYSSTILKERQSLDHQLSHLEEQKDSLLITSYHTWRSSQKDQHQASAD
uniref:Uncharacterized protein n=1 Tax=Anopheles arabiensis TaxID=7173 RepID=A0A182I5T5_ANOAR